MASGATCVQRLDGSRDSAIHTKYRISLRSSSMREPRYPLPRVVKDIKGVTTSCSPRYRGSGACSLFQIPWRSSRPGFLYGQECSRARHQVGDTSTLASRQGGEESALQPLNPACKYVFTGHSAWQVSTMILPQVHLRKPCYDFSFL